MWQNYVKDKSFMCYLIQFKGILSLNKAPPRLELFDTAISPSKESTMAFTIESPKPVWVLSWAEVFSFSARSE